MPVTTGLLLLASFAALILTTWNVPAGAQVLESPILAQDADPEKLFSEGRMLSFEINCLDCYGRTREGFEDGITKIIEAIEAGYEDKVNAYNTLTKAYLILANVYAVTATGEREQFEELFRKTYLKLLSLDPDETELRYYYASSIKDKERVIAEYREILKVDPNHFYVRFSIGGAIIGDYVQAVSWNIPRDASLLDKGIEEVINAVESATLGEVKAVEERVLPTLRSVGLSAEVKLIAKEIQDRIAELEEQARQ